MNAADVATLFRQLAESWQFIFGEDVPQQPLPLSQVAARAVLVLLLGVALVRIGKSRLIGRTTSLDVMMGFLMGSLLSRGITGSASLSGTTVATAALVAAHWLLTRVAYHSHFVGGLVKGHARVIVQDGQPLRQMMNRSHISERDLEEALRLNGTDDLAEVRLVYKERNGELSVVKRKPAPRIVEIAVEPGVQTVRLEIS